MFGLDVELVAWSMTLEIKQRQKPSQMYSSVVMLCISWLEHFLEMPLKVFFVKVFFDNLMNCLNKDAFGLLPPTKVQLGICWVKKIWRKVMVPLIMLLRLTRV